jgi:hypothetical protein
MNIAATVRKDREQHPERYCTQCLWRIQTRGKSTPCPRHPVPPQPSEGTTPTTGSAA